MTPDPIDYHEIARRVNQRLADKHGRGWVLSLVTPGQVAQALIDDGRKRNVRLIREIAAEVAKETK